ncbi:MAG TPA: hypothetical protein VLK35_10260 [Methylomirabilota bacterium]|nr:hypothetical protein [Methylomirabilota bacterium]
MRRVMKLFDPTSQPVPHAVTLARRPASPKGLRLGLVDNTKFNSHTLLRKLGERLACRHGMTVTLTRRKRSPSHAIDEAGITALRAQCDLVISGIGD